LVRKWLKNGPAFLPTLTILFRPSPLGLSAAQIQRPKRC